MSFKYSSPLTFNSVALIFSNSYLTNSSINSSFFRKKRLIHSGGWFGIGEKDTERYWGSTDKFNRLRIEIELPEQDPKDWMSSFSKNKIAIPDYAINKLRKHLNQIRKDYLEKIVEMKGDQNVPISEESQKKKDLIKMINSTNLTKEKIEMIEASLKDMK